jgi:hypothetical protein
MQKLTAVEEAKALFEEAKDWGVWRWLTEKRRARETADAAWEALDACEKKVVAGWPEEVKRAWRATNGSGKRTAHEVDPELLAAAQKVREFDEECNKAHVEAEAQFDEADRRMSTSMAREGSQMAIEAWKMRERFIRKMEGLGRRG